VRLTCFVPTVGFTLVFVAAFGAGCERQSTLELNEPEGAASPGGMNSELAARMEAAAAPGPEHEILTGLVGRWDQQWIYSLDPAAPVEGVATVEARLVLGGRFLWVETKGHPVGAGPGLDSLMVLGFDRRHGEYSSYGCDSGATYCVSARGRYDESTRTLTLSGSDTDPVAKVTQDFQVVFRIGEDRFTTEVVFAPGSFGNDEAIVGARTVNTRRP
jgi:hypothetical protein